jgi:predicted phage replisome organizer
MADVKWIRITTDMFDDEKIKLIEAMPDADSLLIIWIKLICLAGKINNSGNISMTEGVPYTDEDLSTIFSRPLNTVRLALKTFERYRMIELSPESIYLVNFAKHQNFDGLEKIKEQSKLRSAKYRQRQKVQLIQQNNTQLLPQTNTVTLPSRDAEKDNNEVDINSDLVSKNTVTLPSRDVTQQNRIDKNIIREDEKSFNLWNSVLKSIQNNVTNSIFKTYLEGSTGISNGNEFIIAVDNDNKAKYIEKNMGGLLQRELNKNGINNAKIKIVLVDNGE